MESGKWKEVKSGKWKVESGKVLQIYLVLVVALFCLGCKSEEKKAESPSAEKTAVDSLPENIGDKTAPTAIKALKGAKEVKKQMDAQREEESEVLKQSN